MNAKHFLVHVIEQHNRTLPSSPRINIGKELSDHIRETLSREQLTAVLKQRLIEKRKREVLGAELERLERETLQLHGMGFERVEKLRSRIQELKKKI